MRSALGLFVAMSTACLVGACASGGQPVVAPESTVPTGTTTSASSPPKRTREALVMPDLRGLYWADAEPALRTLGWTGVLDKGPSLTNTPFARNQIAAQTPAPGQVISGDAVITLQFAV